MSDDVLRDLDRRGRPRPWRKKKMATTKIAEAFARIATIDDRFASRALRMSECGSWLGFARADDGSTRLRAANFCKGRLCPMCSWRRTLKIFHQVSEVVDRLERDHADLVPLFLTLTVRNCSGGDLSHTLDIIFGGWNKLLKHQRIGRVVRGWFRGVEVTYNRSTDTYHPHIHALLIVDRSYFRSRDYMETSEIVERWRLACGLDYDPVCHLQRVRAAKITEKYKTVAELAKYTVKDTDITRIASNEKRDEVLKVFADALHRRRLCAFGGLLKQIAKDLGQEQLGEGDLVHVEGEDAKKIRADLLEGLEIYTWSQGIGNYIREKRIRKSGV